MAKFKSAVLKVVACPKCGERYEALLGEDEDFRKGVELCSKSTNPAFANAHGFIWCGANIVFSIGRSYTYVGLANMEEQPNRFRRIAAVDPAHPKD